MGINGFACTTEQERWRNLWLAPELRFFGSKIDFSSADGYKNSIFNVILFFDCI